MIEAYTVPSIPNPDIPVFVVEREGGGKTKTYMPN